MLGIKKRRILCWFQKYKLTLVTKYTYKKLFRKKPLFFRPLIMDEKIFAGVSSKAMGAQKKILMLV
jgi:hypothetical protein